jgi:thiol-disulfide isomerase/thioredoxin
MDWTRYITMGCALGLVTINAVAGPRAVRADLRLKDMGGNSHSLEEYRGNIVILNFWATWCVPCKAELPLLVNEQDRYRGRGVVVIAASVDDRGSLSRVRPFIEKQGIEFPVWIGATGDDVARLGLGEAVPATAFIDQDGRIVGRVLGELDRGDLEHRIEWLLGNHQGQSPPPLVNNLK